MIFWILADSADRALGPRLNCYLSLDQDGSPGARSAARRRLAMAEEEDQHHNLKFIFFVYLVIVQYCKNAESG